MDLFSFEIYFLCPNPNNSGNGLTGGTIPKNSQIGFHVTDSCSFKTNTRLDQSFLRLSNLSLDKPFENIIK